MIWIYPALAGLLVVYFAMRSSRFRHFAEPALSVMVAIGLLIAFLVWINDTTEAPSSPPAPSADQGRPSVSPEEIALLNLSFTPAGADRSYRLTGTIDNRSGAHLEYFRLTAVLEDCAKAPCIPFGQDTALILARVPAGQSQDFTTYFTFPSRFGLEPTSPRWTTRVSDIRARLP